MFYPRNALCSFLSFGELVVTFHGGRRQRHCTVAGPSSVKVGCFLQLHYESQPNAVRDVGTGAAGDLFGLAASPHGPGQGNHGALLASVSWLLPWSLTSRAHMERSICASPLLSALDLPGLANYCQGTFSHSATTYF